MTEPVPPLPSLAGAPWLVEAGPVLAAITARGHSARVVGGAVRNALLGVPVTDVDIATTATPGETMALAAAAGLHAVPTGLEHGTITVVAGGTPYEVTTLREDVETFGRHARVAFTSDWVADASRRDFTINALYCDAEGRVHDLLGGWPDALARRVRFIGDPHERIREDYLRILRFFRFHAAYGAGGVDPAGREACIAGRAGLDGLARERVGVEIVKLLAAPGVVPAVAAMCDCGLWPQVLGIAPRPALLARLVACEAAAGRAGDPMLRLSALAMATEEDRARLAVSLRLSREDQAALLVIDGHDAGLPRTCTEALDRRALYRIGVAGWPRRVLAAWAVSAAPVDDQAWSARAGLAERAPPPCFPLTGADVLALGVPPGARVGALLREVEAWWVERDFAADRAALARQLADLARRP